MICFLILPQSSINLSKLALLASLSMSPIQLFFINLSNYCSIIFIGSSSSQVWITLWTKIFLMHWKQVDQDIFRSSYPQLFANIQLSSFGILLVCPPNKKFLYAAYDDINHIKLLWRVGEDPSLICPTLNYFPMPSSGWFDNLIWYKQIIKIDQDCTFVLLKSETLRGIIKLYGLNQKRGLTSP